MGKKRLVARRECKFCGTELSDYREFCDAFCRGDYLASKVDDGNEAKFQRQKANYEESLNG